MAQFASSQKGAAVVAVRLAYAEVLVHLVAAVHRAGEHLHTVGKMRAEASSAQVLFLGTFVLSPALLVSSGCQQ